MGDVGNGGGVKGGGGDGTGEGGGGDGGGGEGGGGDGASKALTVVMSDGVDWMVNASRGSNAASKAATLWELRSFAAVLAAEGDDMTTCAETSNCEPSARLN